ncbi:unnamed protein product [Acanthoscelides obtectus]|uniref:Uncharacterized protein n=1 Tax=Acanthoscelides obtectus TaxID=200917 RepID=A0A9P0PQM1_ACAOB|nr:unnamed protein product [Acanthoscelides obtectus]CAH1993227.1 unnamed protein product [Acanthoscelides obtectus]CAK1620758.1 hypothetical protein AOBTE_LOCUS544 [Acanthoscelides obtectus]CAK1620759.1 hypothetical protein AOBTE_LOCUS545 [Acanthoscelides obtectus]
MMSSLFLFFVRYDDGKEIKNFLAIFHNTG